MMRALFTKVEQFLVKNNHTFVLDKNSERHVGTSSSEDGQNKLKDLLTSLDRPHPYISHLLRNSSTQRFDSFGNDEEDQAANQHRGRHKENI